MSFLRPLQTTPTSYNLNKQTKTQAALQPQTRTLPTYNQNTTPHNQQPLPYKKTKTQPKPTTLTPAIELTSSNLLKLVNPQSHLLFLFLLPQKLNQTQLTTPPKISQVQYRMYVRPGKQPRLKQSREADRAPPTLPTGHLLRLSVVCQAG